MAERSAGKDSVTGHWELMGVVLDRAFPTFPRRVSAPIGRGVRARIGRPVARQRRGLGHGHHRRARRRAHAHRPADRLHVRRQRVPDCGARGRSCLFRTLYDWCRERLRHCRRGAGLGRVIARPFVGAPGSFRRTANRHDYAMPPSGETLLDRLTAHGHHGHCHWQDQRSVRGTRHRRGASRPPATTTAWTCCRVRSRRPNSGLLFANLVDFDTLYGHRNDVGGYARNLERFDRRLAAAAAAAHGRTIFS